MINCSYVYTNTNGWDCQYHFKKIFPPISRPCEMMVTDGLLFSPVADARGGTIRAAAAAGRLALLLVYDKMADGKRHYSQKDKAYNDRSDIFSKKIHHNFFTPVKLG